MEQSNGQRPVFRSPPSLFSALAESKSSPEPTCLVYFPLHCCSSGCCHENRLSQINSGFFLLILILSSSDTQSISTLVKYRVSFSSFEKISNHQQVHRLSRIFYILWWALRFKLDSLSYELLSGFCVGCILLQILFCSFQLCVQGAHYSCLSLCSSTTSVISYVISPCPPLLPLAVLFSVGFCFFQTFSGFLSLSLPYFLPCGLISVFRPFLACQTARVRLTESLHCPQEGFLTASCELHISNW